MTIFLDHNSTTITHPIVLEAMIEIYKKPLNNSSIHQFGRQAVSFVNKSIKSIKNLLNAENYNVIFTSGSTESCNHVLFNHNVNQFFYSSIEHSCIFNCRPNEKKITEFKCDANGVIDVENFEKIISKQNSFLTSAMLANNETGAIQPVNEISRITHQNHGYFLCDIVQAVGKIPIDLEEINADFVCLSGHKFNAPQGIGALLIRKDIDLKPLIYGGSQQQGKRAGTLNVASIVGLGIALEIANKRLDEFSKISILRDFLENSIQEIAKEYVKIISKEASRLANTSFIALRNVDAQTQLINFDLNNICVSNGSACSSGSTFQSRILKALNIDKHFLNNAIRVSLGFENTKSDIEKFISVWYNFYKQKFNK